MTAELNLEPPPSTLPLPPHPIEDQPNIPEDEDMQRSSPPHSSICCQSPIAPMLAVNQKLRLLRHYTLVPWGARAVVTLLLVAFLSLLEGTDELQHVDALTSKNSILNQVFVKYGWAWTLAAYTALVLPLLPLSPEPLMTGIKALFRAALLTAIFYFWCAQVFPTIEQWTGLCLSKNVVVSRHSKRKCIKAGHTFYSFDVSGHAFLMVYCVLTLLQEAQAMHRYISLGQAIADLDNSKGRGGRAAGSLVEQMSGPETSDDGSGEDAKKGASSTRFINNRDSENGGYLERKSMTTTSSDGSSSPASDSVAVSSSGARSSEPVSAHEAAKFRGVYLRVWPVVAGCYVAVLFLCLVWDTVLVITTIYYHSIIEKVLGVAIAVVSWAALYKGLFVKVKLV